MTVEACRFPGDMVSRTGMRKGCGMDHEGLRHWSKRAADWAADYHATLRDRPVRAPLVPGAVARQLPAGPPEAAEAYLNAAYEEAWNRLKERDPTHYEALREKFFKEQ